MHHNDSLVETIERRAETIRIQKTEIEALKHELDQERRRIETFLPGIVTPDFSRYSRPDAFAQQYVIRARIPEVRMLVSEEVLRYAKYPVEAVLTALRNGVGKYAEETVKSVLKGMKNPENLVSENMGTPNRFFA